LERFDAHVFFKLSALLTHVQQPEIDALDWKSRFNWIAILEPYEIVCERLEFKASRAAVHELLQMLPASEVGSGLIRDRLKELQRRLKDEMSYTFFLALSGHEARLLDAVTPFGDDVANAFPSASFDADEATRCLAFERYTACVLHLMRVLEVGVRALGARLAIDTTHKPGWEAILKKAHGQLSLPNDKKDPDWINDEAFLSDAIAMFTAVKTAWRNPTMHIEKTYTPEQAERIYDAVNGFMQQLATKLHE
jgi:hypothetical protein